PRIGTDVGARRFEGHPRELAERVRFRKDFRNCLILYRLLRLPLRLRNGSSKGVGVGEITVAEAADRLGVSPSRVRALVGAGSLPGRKVGGLWLLEEDAVDAAGRDPRRSGRPLSPRM